MPLTLRQTKGSALTHAEMDANWSHVSNYTNLTNRPAIPSAVSELINDSGYQRVVSVPNSPQGQEGNLEGDIAIDNNYLYYCTSTFYSENSWTVTSTGSGDGAWQDDNENTINGWYIDTNISWEDAPQYVINTIEDNWFLTSHTGSSLYNNTRYISLLSNRYGNVRIYGQTTSGSGLLASSGSILTFTRTTTNNEIWKSIPLLEFQESLSNVSISGSYNDLTNKPIIEGPIFMAYNSSNQSMLTGSTDLIYATTTFDVGNYYNTSTGRYTPLVSGYYQVNVSFTPELVSGTANASFFPGLFKNGSLLTIGPSVTVTPTWGTIGCSNISYLVYLNGSTDYLEIGSNNTIYSGIWRTGISMGNYFQAAWIRS
jgi:hypothetical protein